MKSEKYAGCTRCDFIGYVMVPWGTDILFHVCPKCGHPEGGVLIELAPGPITRLRKWWKELHEARDEK